MHTRIFVLLLTFGNCWSKVLDLETNSVFYGITLAASNQRNDTLCRQQMEKITRGIDNQERWAIKLLDASGVPSTGLLWGHTFWLGSRDQCTRAHLTSFPYLNSRPGDLEWNLAGSLPFTVNYYIIHLVHNSPHQLSVHWNNEKKISIGLCLPSSCHEKELFEYMKFYLQTQKLHYLYIYSTTLDVLEIKRSTENFSFSDNPISVLFLFTTIIITFLIIIGSWYDIYIHRSQKLAKSVIKYEINGNTDAQINRNYITNKGNGYCSELKVLTPKSVCLQTWEKIIISFSWVNNFNQIFDMSPEPGILRPICGLRLYTTIFVIFSHSYLFALDFYNNRVHFFYLTNLYSIQIFANSSLSTDAFFCMSGFLMAHGFYKLNRQNKYLQESYWKITKSYLIGVFKRFIRFTPSYMYALGITFIIASWRYGASSLEINERNDISCPKYWWTNILYINNIYPGKEMCMSWTYYLSNEMQFFVIVTFLCHLSKKNFKLATVLLFSLLFGSITYTSYTTYIMDYRPLLVNFFRYMDIFYYPPWMRIGTYIIGVMYGYLYHQIEGKINLQQKFINLTWVLVLIVMTYIELGLIDKNMSLIQSMIYNSLIRHIWAVCVGWIILACLTGHGGILNDVLSARCWIPLSRLTYWVYLINPILTYSVASFSDKSYQIDCVNSTITAIGNATLSFIISLVMVMSIEMPFDKIYNIIRQSDAVNKKKKMTSHITKED